jgi:dUTP pyrophosphatase
VTRAVDTLVVIFEALHEDVIIPQRATEQSAGYDVRAYLFGRPTMVMTASGPVDRTPSREGTTPYVELAPGERAIVPLGFRARLPAGCEGQLRMRSSVAFRKGLTMPNAPGTIDADYPDEWLVMLRNDGAAPARIEHGERIAQVVIARYETPRWERGTVGTSTSRSGGVGSTG